MDLDALNKIATAMVAPGKGILAADVGVSLSGKNDRNASDWRGPTPPEDKAVIVKCCESLCRDQ
jgi:hypothetical protein